MVPRPFHFLGVILHLIYSDESGDDGLPKRKNQPHKGSKYFIRCGLSIHDKKWRAIDAKVREFRSSHSIPNDLEIHATEIANGKTNRKIKASNGKRKRQSSVNWFGRNFRSKDARRDLLVSLIETVFNAGVITVFGIIIDKKNIDLTLPLSNPNRNPKLKSLELLSERFTHHIMGQKDQNGLIILDSVNLTDDGNLRDFQNQLYRKSSYVTETCFVESLMFSQSHTTNMLQIADVCAYALFRHYECDDPVLFDIIKPHMHKNEKGSIDGAGLKIWPLGKPKRRAKHKSKKKK